MFHADDELVELKEGIDLQDLQDPNKGVEFEIDGDAVKQGLPETNKYFSGEEVFRNMLDVDDETLAACDREGLEKFDVLMRTMEDITERKDGGVWKKLMQPGYGPVAPQGALVRVHYNAYQELDPEPFDSTRLRHEVEKFRLGIDGTVAGLHVAVATMKKGERSRFIFKPEYYYGKLGCAPRIPPDCTVLFDIELIGFVEQEGVDDYYQLTEEEKRQVKFPFVCKVSKAEREEGNQLFNIGMYSRALNKYKRAARILEDYHLKNDTEEKEQHKLLVKVYSNISLCCLKLKQNGLTITFCHKVMDLDPQNVKAYFRNGQALHSMSEFEQARNMYRKAQQLDGQNRDIRNALTKLEQDVRRFRIQKDDFREMCRRMMAMPLTNNDKTEDNQAINDENSGELIDKCSERFKTTAKEKLGEFCRDPDVVEMPFPEQSLTVAEIEYIVEVAESLNLKIQRQGTGNAARMVVVKRKEQLQIF